MENRRTLLRDAAALYSPPRALPEIYALTLLLTSESDTCVRRRRIKFILFVSKVLSLIPHLLLPPDDAAAAVV